MTSKFASSRALRCIVLGLLGLSAATSFGQSRDWRLGYEQGFRDGVASVQGGRPPMHPAPPGVQPGRVMIQDAVFGTRGATCNARDAVQNIVDRNAPNRVFASTQLCGDPARNQPKTLWVTYRCDNRRPAVTVSAPEGRWLNLPC